MVRSGRQLLAAVWYVLVRGFSSQRLVAPLVVYLIGALVLSAVGASALDSGMMASLVLVPVGAWLAIVSLTADDRSQRAVVSTSLGSPTRARVVTALSRAAACWILGVAGAGIALVSDPARGASDGAAVVVAVVLLTNVVTLAAGTSIGTLCSPPVIRSRGRAWFTAVLLCLAVVGLPVSPLQRFYAAVTPGQASVDDVWLPFAASTVSAGVLFVMALVIARRRED